MVRAEADYAVISVRNKHLGEGGMPGAKVKVKVVGETSPQFHFHPLNRPPVDTGNEGLMVCSRSDELGMYRSSEELGM